MNCPIESQEFRHWLKKNNTCLRAYAPDQIAYLALQNGFSLGVACEHISDHVTQLKRLLEFWASPFYEKWLMVTDYQLGTDDY